MEKVILDGVEFDYFPITLYNLPDKRSRIDYCNQVFENSARVETWAQYLSNVEIKGISSIRDPTFDQCDHYMAHVDPSFESQMVDGVDLGGYTLDPEFLKLTRDEKVKWCKEKIEKEEGHEVFVRPYELYLERHPRERPSWDEYFMELAKMTAQRSCDPSSQHGCVIVDKRNRVVSMGYNGTVAGIPESDIDWTRPNKYAWMLHAEENAVAFAKESLEETTSYVTGPSCVKCLRLQLQMGIRNFVFGPLVSMCTKDSYDQEVCAKMIERTGSKVRYME